MKQCQSHYQVIHLHPDIPLDIAVAVQCSTEDSFYNMRFLLFVEKAGAAYVIDDQGSGRGEVQYVQTMPVQTMQTVQTVPVVNGSQPVILVESGSVRSQPVGTLRSHKSNKRNFQL